MKHSPTLHKKRVFIIGAGASSEYGVAIGKNYLKECLEFVKDLKEEKYSKYAEEIENYLDNLIPGGKEIWIDKPFEMINSLLEKDRIIKSKIAVLSSEPYIGDKLNGCLCMYLWHCSYNPNNISIDKLPKEDWPYSKFVKKLDNINDTIITTNYDAFLELAMFANENSIRYSEYYNISSVLLLKPLGSITWIPNLTGDEEIHEFVNEKEGVKVGKVKEIMYRLSDSPVIWCYKQSPKYFKLDGTSKYGNYPVIIPPTIGADIPTSWGDFFVNLYKQMFNKLSTADEIYIIGYSFPEYYELFRLLLWRALKSNPNNFNNGVKLFVINKGEYPKPEEYKKENKLTVWEIIHQYIAKVELNYYNEGFKKWLECWINDNVNYDTISK